METVFEGSFADEVLSAAADRKVSRPMVYVIDRHVATARDFGDMAEVLTLLDRYESEALVNKRCKQALLLYREMYLDLNPIFRQLPLSVQKQIIESHSYDRAVNWAQFFSGLAAAGAGWAGAKKAGVKSKLAKMLTSATAATAGYWGVGKVGRHVAHARALKSAQRRRQILKSRCEAAIKEKVSTVIDQIREDPMLQAWAIATDIVDQFNISDESDIGHIEGMVVFLVEYVSRGGTPRITKEKVSDMHALDQSYAVKSGRHGKKTRPAQSQTKQRKRRRKAAPTYNQAMVASLGRGYRMS